jgi:hypothetical protein
VSIDHDLEHLSHISLSTIAAHAGNCCNVGQAALLNRLVSGATVAACLAAIPQVVQWTPTVWPVHWCELRHGPGYLGDCGVHADLAGWILRSHGIDHQRCRAALRPYSNVKDHWTATWAETQASGAWIASELVHHEVLRVGDRFWDPTEACWFDGAGSYLSAGVVLATKQGGCPWKLVDG